MVRLVVDATDVNVEVVLVSWGFQEIGGICFGPSAWPSLTASNEFERFWEDAIHGQRHNHTKRFQEAIRRRLLKATIDKTIT